jgi:hypothetical protein
VVGPTADAVSLWKSFNTPCCYPRGNRPINYLSQAIPCSKTGRRSPKIGESMKALKKHSPGTFDGYWMLHEAGAQTGHLDTKTRELFALAVAVTTRCDSCIASHARKAMESDHGSGNGGSARRRRCDERRSGARILRICKWTRSVTCQETTDCFRRHGRSELIAGCIGQRL